MRFFGRAPSSRLPNSIERNVSHLDLVKERQRKQTVVAQRKGNISRDQFSVGNRVRIRQNEPVESDRDNRGREKYYSLHPIESVPGIKLVTPLALILFTFFVTTFILVILFPFLIVAFFPFPFLC